MSSHLQIIEHLETVIEALWAVLKIYARRLAELGDTETGRDELAAADELYRKYIGGGED